MTNIEFKKTDNVKHLQTTIKLRKSLKGIPNFCKLQIVFRSQNKSPNAFCFQDRKRIYNWCRLQILLWNLQ